MKLRSQSLGLGVAIAAWSLASPANALVTLNNGIYEVHVQEIADTVDKQYGSWNAVTAAGHPVGAGRNLLYTGSDPLTNFSSLRVFGSGGSTTDYTFRFVNGSETLLDGFLVSQGVSPYGSPGTGFREVWDVATEGLTITQDLVVTGTTLDDSAIYHSVEITNSGSSPVDFGWRNVYDWNVSDPGFDDGPANSVEQPGGTVVVPASVTEFTHIPGADDFVRVAVDQGIPSYEILLALGYDPGFIPALPVTLPDVYAFAAWPNLGVSSTAFDYTTTGLDIATDGLDNDSAGVSWFGRDLASAYTLDVGESVRFTQILFAVFPSEAPPGDPPAAVSEPGTFAILGIGLVAMGAFGRRRRPFHPAPRQRRTVERPAR